MKVRTKTSKLSSTVLQMKFMKRAAVDAQEELALEEQRREIDDEHWYLDVDEEKIESQTGSVLVEPSYTIFDGIGFGRMSFNGFNPQIEKLMKPKETDAKEESDHEKEIDDDEMADHYSSTLGKTINKKFQSSNKKVSEKKPKVKRL